MKLPDVLPRLSAALLAIGIAGGTALDRMPARTASFRGGYRVLEADFHAHTRFCDGFLSPFDLVVQAQRRGLDVLAVTEHNVTYPAFMARWFARGVGGPTVLVGEEVTTKHYHLHGVGLTRRVDASMPLRDVLADIHAQGGVAIAAHPAGRLQKAFLPEIDRIDASELMHPLVFQDRGAGWRWVEMREFYERALASGHRLTAVGSSDYHFFSPLGVCRTLVFAKDDGEESVLDALKAGRTVVHDLEGRAYGDPAMVEALAKEPYAMREQDYGYRGNGPADRVMRAAGFLGLVGLVLFGLRRRQAR
jgi:hypothetical protein